MLLLIIACVATGCILSVPVIRLTRAIAQTTRYGE